ncbi:MAG: RDD family protein [Firmicutes bacterium]|nr:RDD family protein [Bacillota bacterium]
MKADVGGRQIELSPNSKPYLLKRMVADGFDILLIFGLFMLFTMILLRTPIAKTYQTHFDAAQAIQKETVEAFGNDADAVTQALSSNMEYQNELFTANIYSYVMKALAALLAEIPVLLIVPYLNKNRSTPGKLMTGIMLFSERRNSRARWYQIFYRFLFVFLIDSLGLYLFTGILTFLMVPVVRLMEMLLNKKNKTICDFVTGIMVIEKLSYNGIH